MRGERLWRAGTRHSEFTLAECASAPGTNNSNKLLNCSLSFTEELMLAFFYLVVRVLSPLLP